MTLQELREWHMGQARGYCAMALQQGAIMQNLISALEIATQQRKIDAAGSMRLFHLEAVAAMDAVKPAPQPVIADTLREAFEAAYRARYGPGAGCLLTMTHHKGVYAYLPMQIGWAMWQDAAKLYGAGGTLEVPRSVVMTSTHVALIDKPVDPNCRTYPTEGK